MIYRERRYPCRFPTTLTAAGQGVPAVFVNVSFHGALAVADTRLRLGDRVTFALTNLPIHAQVVRVAPGGETGLRFERPLSKVQLGRLRATLRPGGRPVGFTEMA